MHRIPVHGRAMARAPRPLARDSRSLRHPAPSRRPRRQTTTVASLNTTSIAALLAAIFLFSACAVTTLSIMAHKSSLFASVLPSVIVNLTNADRTASHVSALVSDPLLAKAAQLKANDMAKRGYFSHTSPDGKTPWYWLDSVKYEYVYAGENLANDFTESKDVEEAWMSSPSHRANIVKSQYTRIGVGVAHGKYNGQDTTFVVQFFATTPKDIVAPQPVATAPVQSWFVALMR